MMQLASLRSFGHQPQQLPAPILLTETDVEHQAAKSKVLQTIYTLRCPYRLPAHGQQLTVRLEQQVMLDMLDSSLM
jgi:hypothetical protein